MTYMHEKYEFIVRRQQLVFLCGSKASTVDKQKIGRAATGSNDVRLTTDKSKSLKAKIIQHANDISM